MWVFGRRSAIEFKGFVSEGSQEPAFTAFAIADCRTGSPGQMREQIEILQLQLAAAQGNSAKN
jgi:hypothetical protein